MFIVNGGGICQEISASKYGQQALGISPAGAADQLAFSIAHILLGEPENYRCLEIIYPPKQIVFTKEVIFCLTGSGFPNSILNSTSTQQQIHHAQNYRAQAGDILTLNGARQGLRTYLMIRSWNSQSSQYLNLARGNFQRYFTPYSNIIYVTQGPEFNYLLHPEQFLAATWEIDSKSNAMGTRLIGNPCELRSYDIISAPVVDGVIQFTSGGPIVLMRQRQTIGGYPRCLVVTQPSLNHLAQIQFRQAVRFRLITHEQAQQNLQEHLKQLQNFRQTILKIRAE
jgi:allophanate hydrolase subunit 2